MRWSAWRGSPAAAGRRRAGARASAAAANADLADRSTLVVPLVVLHEARRRACPTGLSWTRRRHVPPMDEGGARPSHQAGMRRQRSTSARTWHHHCFVTAEPETLVACVVAEPARSTSDGGQRRSAKSPIIGPRGRRIRRDAPTYRVLGMRPLRRGEACQGWRRCVPVPVARGRDVGAPAVAPPPRRQRRQRCVTRRGNNEATHLPARHRSTAQVLLRCDRLGPCRNICPGNGALAGRA